MSQHGCPERLSSRSKGFSEEGTSQPTMEVLVETLTGTAFEMTVSPSDTIFAIKSKIFRVEGIPVCQQHLLYNLHELEDGRSLREQRVVDGARLRLVLALRGGPVATRRLPPPPPVRRDLDRLLDANRDEASGGGGGGCKVTVVVVREGERVSVLRVLENEDGTYSPLTHHHTYSSSLRSLSEDGVECDSDSGSGGEDGLCAVHENAVTMGKMMELRRRMETLSLQRSSRPVRPHQPRSPRHQNDRRVETQDVMQKTRSEETLAVSSLFEERALGHCRAGSFLCSEPEEGFAPLYDGSYTRLDYDCPFADRYALLPPIGVRADSDHSLRDALDADTLAGSLLVKEETAILEEGAPECHRPHPRGPPQPRTHAPLAHALSAAAASPPATADYGPLVSGEASGWRAHTFGSSSQLVGGAIGGPGGALTATGGVGASAVTSGRLSAGPHSASSLQLRAPPPRHHPPLSDAVFSSSTSDLEALRRNRLLPALSRHPNTEHLHLSDDRLNRQRRAPHALEVGSERRQRRVNAVLSELAPSAHSPAPSAQFAQVQPPEKKSGGRMRCALCRRRLTVATVHTCRCGGEFCAPHRYAEAHGCHYDYKALAATRQHPPLAAPKLPKI